MSSSVIREGITGMPPSMRGLLMESYKRCTSDMRERGVYGQGKPRSVLEQEKVSTPSLPLSCTFVQYVQGLAASYIHTHS